jgi:hydroxymethylglutaryl-CoA lyase
MANRGVTILSLADTVGIAEPAQIGFALNALIPKYPEVTIGVHLHASPLNWQAKLEAAVDAGCTRIDGALKGIGGCPMAQDDLVGNMDTENIIRYGQQKGKIKPLNKEALQRSLALAGKMFG